MSRVTPSTFLTGFLIGGAVGAIAALLSAREPGIALTSLRARRHHRAQQPVVDDALDASFPASDPPSWTPAASGTGADA